MVKRRDHISKGRRTNPVIWYEEVSYQIAKSIEATRKIRDLAKQTPERWTPNQIEALCKQLERESQAIKDAYANSADLNFILPLGNTWTPSPDEPES